MVGKTHHPSSASLRSEPVYVTKRRSIVATFVMGNVFWVLGKKQYESYDLFITAVTEYNNKIAPARNEWQPDREISPQPIRVFYEAMWKNEDDTISIDIGDNDRALTMGRLLFALNNLTSDFFKDADARYFEGFAILNNRNYELLVGS
jgi:hypothetical protein